MFGWPRPSSSCSSHPYAILFGIVLAEQVGVPLPSVPVLLAAGALAGLGKIGAAPALSLAVLATVIADLVWFEAGRRRGNKVVKFVCKVSLEPDSCVRRTEDVFSRYGPRSLLFVKFVPGLGLMAVTLAGAFGLRRRRFLLYDLPGAMVWAGSYIALGYVFSAQLERAIQAVSQLGFTVAGLVLALIALWLMWKYVQRRRFIRELLHGPHHARGPAAEARRGRADRDRGPAPSARIRGRSAHPARRAALRHQRSRAAPRARSRATATSSSTAPDPARPRAPVWRSCSGDGGSRACGRWPEASSAGATRDFRWRERRARPDPEGPPQLARSCRCLRTPPAMSP